MKNNTIVIGLGGSVLFPGGVWNKKFMRVFRDSILDHRNKYVIVVGGGSIARLYQHALADVGIQNRMKQDRIGITATHVNAELVRLLFGARASAHILSDFHQKIPKQHIVVAGGTGPGWSTDYVTLVWGKKLQSKKIIIISNTDGIFTKNPKEKGARLIPDMTWGEYCAYLKKCHLEKWKPGAHIPLDPKAAAFGKKEKLVVSIINAKPHTLEAALRGQYQHIPHTFVHP